MSDTRPEPDDIDEIDPGIASDAVGDPDRRTKRRRSRIVSEDELDTQSFMVENGGTVARLHVASKSLHATGGDAVFLGNIIHRGGQLIRKVADSLHPGDSFGNPQLSVVAFGNSVDLVFDLSQGEAPQRNMENQESSPTIDAVEEIARLMASPADELLQHALELGSDVAVAYKALLKEIVDEDATAEWQTARSSTVVSITSAEAQHDFAILDQLGERTHEDVVVTGRLCGADSDAHNFKLLLPKARPSILKQRQKISGSMSDAMAQKVKSEDLWNSTVTATIRVEFDKEGTSATKRDPRFELLDASKAVDESLF